MKEYVGILEKGEEGWGAWVPDLPGCVAAGATRQDAERLIRDAIPLHIELMKEQNLPVPEPSSAAAVVSIAA